MMWAKTLADCIEKADMWVWQHLQIHQIWVFSQTFFHSAELSVLKENEMPKDLPQFPLQHEQQYWITDKLKYLQCVQDTTKLWIWGVEG